MGSDATSCLTDGESASVGAALQHGHWRRFRRLSSVAEALENFLAASGFDRAPWLAVAFASGIGLWFALENRWQWLALLAGMAGLASSAALLARADGRFPFLRQALIAVPVMIAAGCGVVWLKSALVGTPAIAGPRVTTLSGTVLSREERPAEQRVRLIVATRDPDDGRPIRVRLNLPEKLDRPGFVSGAWISGRARLMPPAPPMLPGGYDFARTAWFKGLAATGTALGPFAIVEPAESGRMLDDAQAALSSHVRSRLDGGSGAIAATLASGDRGAIPPADDQAMRDSGLAHLLSISGLHVTAVVGAAYLIALRLLALWPWLALRVRLPIAAAGAGALAGIGYTLLTGAEVPTVRSCVAALLVLAALALGRQPLSLRMVAAAGLFVMLFWPEAVVGPSFQMSFSAVIAIVALHGAAPVRAFLAPREEPLWVRWLRQGAVLLLTGVVIELALMPIGLYHFHRAGVYGALANLIAIPLTTMVTMPLIALALVLDIVKAGAPAWWLVGKSLDFLLWLAHLIASRPGAVTAMPAFGAAGALTIAAGGFWLAFWQGRARMLGLVPAAIGAVMLMQTRAPDVLVSGDGRHVAIVEGGQLAFLRDARAGYARDTAEEVAGAKGPSRGLAARPGTVCNRDFCFADVVREGRAWRLLLSRGRDNVPERALAAACDRADIVISDRWLPASCRPRWIKADRRLLAATGGLAIDLAGPRIRTVAEHQGEHGWWRARDRRPPLPRPVASPPAASSDAAFAAADAGRAKASVHIGDDEAGSDGAGIDGTGPPAVSSTAASELPGYVATPLRDQ